MAIKALRLLVIGLTSNFKQYLINSQGLQSITLRRKLVSQFPYLSQSGILYNIEIFFEGSARSSWNEYANALLPGTRQPPVGPTRNIAVMNAIGLGEGGAPTWNLTTNRSIGFDIARRFQLAAKEDAQKFIQELGTGQTSVVARKNLIGKFFPGVCL